MTQRKLTILIFIFLYSLSCSAASLDIWQKYAKLSKLTADFSQTKVLKSLGVSLKSKGHLHFDRPDFFEWSVTDPANYVFTFKNNTISMSENGKVVKNADAGNLDKKVLAAIAHIKAWMMIDQKFIEENYEIKKISSDSYDFTPKTDLKMFKKIQIELGKDYPIKKISLMEVSGDEMQIEFSKTKLTYEK